jgi:hypothetical protein
MLFFPASFARYDSQENALAVVHLPDVRHYARIRVGYQFGRIYGIGLQFIPENFADALDELPPFDCACDHRADVVGHADLLGSGIVTRLDRPGGNITGFALNEALAGSQVA